ncbi:hypothetical protein HA052_04655 [Chromobacterium haemolyticum]|uniref:Uncharacterized protein n=2 Tax=Chromobacterium fluminis TaxID=3044269 RepID=A0ABX0L560_9NEIS|nr:hypothetical protein [Chromobacterium haemolyticum]
MSVAYNLACLETGQYVWVGALAPGGHTVPEGPAGSIARFALDHRGKPLIVVNDTPPILMHGTEWGAGTGQAMHDGNRGILT